MLTSVILLEFKHEADYVLKNFKGRSDVGILCTNLSLRKKLEENGFQCFDILKYFKNDDHFYCLEKIDELSDAILDIKEDEIDLGKLETFKHSSLFYLDFFYSHLIYIDRLLKNLLTINAQITDVITFKYLNNEKRNPALNENESYLDVVVENVLKDFNICASYVELYHQAPLLKAPGTISKSILKFVNKINLGFLKLFFTKKSLWFGSKSNGTLNLLDELGVERAATLDGLNRVGYSQHFGWFKFLGKSVISMLKGFKDRTYSLDLYPIELESKQTDQFVEVLKKQIEKKGYSGFSSVLISKVNFGISKLIFQLNGLYFQFESLIKKSSPLAVISPHSLNGTKLLGALSSRHKIPGLLISHGSHSDPKDKRFEKEFHRHGLGLINSDYTHVAIQTPLALNYYSHFKLKSEPVMTGPLLWGKNHAGLEKTNPKMRTLVHAGTQKPRNSFRFGFYETPDEYVQAIKELADAMEHMENTKLIIRFRPTDNLTANDLMKLVPASEKVEYSLTGSFMETLMQATALVSYSSTTMEEALENGVPVIQYGSEGRFTFLPGQDVEVDTEVTLAPVYNIKSSENLEKKLEKILNVCGDANLGDEHLSHYVFPKGERFSLKQWIRQVNYEN